MKIDQDIIKHIASRKHPIRKWWAVCEGRVEYVTGYFCPQNPDVWWCPEMGHSLTEGYQLFPTEAEALDSAMKDTNRKIAELEKLLCGFRVRRYRTA